MEYALNRGGYVSASAHADIFSCRSACQLPASLQVHAQFKQFCMPPHSYLLPIDKRSPLVTRVSTISADRIGIMQWVYFSLSDPSLIPCHPFSSQTVKRFSYSQPAYIRSYPILPGPSPIVPHCRPFPTVKTQSTKDMRLFNPLSGLSDLVVPFRQ